MNKFIAILTLSTTAALTGCGGGSVGGYAAVIDDPRAPVPQVIYENLRYPTISGLEFVNSLRPAESYLTDARGTYIGYAGDDTVTFVLGDIVLFTMPGYLASPYSSLYDGAA